jgi:hypothetical protein
MTDEICGTIVVSNPTTTYDQPPRRRLHAFRLCWESWCVLALGVIFGGLALLVVPPVVTLDGPSHYYRTLEISLLHPRSQSISENGLGRRLPTNHVHFVEELWTSYWGKKDFLGLDGWKRLSEQKATVPGRTLVGFMNTAVYSPINYGPQSVAFAIGGVVGLSPVTLCRGATFLTLASYLGMMVAALEFLPRFRRGLALIASSPLIVIQRRR